MDDSGVTVRAGARLHLGLVKTGDGPDFVSAGLSLASPVLKVNVSWRETGAKSGPAMAIKAAEAALKNFGVKDKVSIRIIEDLPRHFGLGSGTRLALSSAAAAIKLAGKRMEVLKVAKLTGRGKRSAMGSVLFAKGGVAADMEGQIVRTAAPMGWRVALITPLPHAGDRGGANGFQEEMALANVASIKGKAREDAADAAVACIVGGASMGDFSLFSEGVSTLQRIAARKYGPLQGGPASTVNGRAILRKLVREGWAACGQSSWGPLIFAVAPSIKDAGSLQESACSWKEVSDVNIVRISNSGRLFL
ncbi:MAG: hypothetical protein OEZ04_09900 [Nitrospinota bacterium]|nr:hypothetical protein [Nitrospinota bacterium]